MYSSNTLQNLLDTDRIPIRFKKCKNSLSIVDFFLNLFCACLIIITFALCDVTYKPETMRMPLSLMCLSICLRRPHIKSTSALNPGLQPYKYTGKELDLTHGLNTYGHGARQNFHAYLNFVRKLVCGHNTIMGSGITIWNWKYVICSRRNIEYRYCSCEY